MSSPQTLILADDLTGANDTAIQFVKKGLSALVLTDSVPEDLNILDDYDVVSINFNSRGLSGKDAYRVVNEAFRQLPAAKKYTVYKKVDSVLRGNPGQELSAIMDALDIKLAIAASSFPANRSIVEKGMLYSGGAKTSNTSAVKIFADGTGRKTENLPLDVTRAGLNSIVEFINRNAKNGVQIFVADAVSDEDLEIIYNAVESLTLPHVFAGSAGLANQLAVKLGKTREPNAVKLPALTPALMVAGTRQGETAAQIDAAVKALKVPVVRFDTELGAEGKIDEAVERAYHETAGQMKAGHDFCIVGVSSLFGSGVKAGDVDRAYAEGDETGTVISKALGKLTGKLFDAFGFKVVISTGGDTSMGICRQLAITGIEPLAEICPGIPIGRIRGGVLDGRYIVTKSGRFGDSNSLIEIMNYLGRLK